MKVFHSLSVTYRWAIAVLFSAILALILLWWVQKVSDAAVWGLLIFIIVPIIQFLLTPIFIVLGVYTYYSKMVVTFGLGKQVLDLHNGTSFDYLLDMRNSKPGFSWKKEMLGYFFEALSEIIEQIEDHRLPSSLTVRGSSYFLTQRSAKRLGFTARKASVVEQLNIALNYFDLIWMHSLANGKLTFPKLANIYTVSISGVKLVEHKEVIARLLHRLRDD